MHLSLFSRVWSRNHFCKYTFISVLNHFFCFRITAGNTNSLYHRKKIKIGYSASLFISSNDSSGSIILFDGFCFGLFLSVRQETKTKNHSLWILFEWLMYLGLYSTNLYSLPAYVFAFLNTP